MLPSRRRIPLLGLLALFIAALSTGAASAATVRIGEAPQLPGGATLAGTLAPQRPLDLMVALEPRDPGALALYAEGVSTPGSPVYGRYLSVPEFAARFAPTPGQVATVRAALTARGLEVGEAAANGLSLPVSATAAEAEAAFGTAIDRVRLASGEASYSNAGAPAVPAAAAPYVQGVIGLNDLSRPHRADGPAAGSAASNPLAPAPRVTPTVATGGPQPCAAASEIGATQGGYTADQLAAAYGLAGFYAAGDFGAGQTVALYEEEPLLPSDIATFQACYGTSVPVETVDVAGGPGPYKGEDGEAAMDVEQMIQLAPGAHVRVYQGPNENGTEAAILTSWVTEDVAKVMSSSWGLCEKETNDPAAMAATSTLLQEAAAQGQSFFVAAGDYGSADCETETDHDHSLNVDFPGSDPFATDVGGTRLQEPTAAQPLEYLWNEAPYWGAGGGGISEDFPMPDYQSMAAPGLGVIGALSSGKTCGFAGYCRQVPDVSADAAVETGYVIYAEGAWEVNGGTSAAAPLWGAVATLTNASAACAGHTIGFANPALYAIAGSDYAANFRDIVEPKPGGKPTTNRLDESKPYPAVPGYDMATGLGTPIGSSLGASLCALQPPVPTSPPTPAPVTPITKPASPAPPAPQPHFSGARLAGVGKGKPNLSFGIEARPGANLESVTIALPAGLVPSPETKALVAGLVVRETTGKRLGVKSRVTGRTIRVTLTSPRPALKLTLRSPALTVSPKLLAQLHSPRPHKLAVMVTARESGGQSARFPLSLSAS